MKITKSWLEKQKACIEGVEWFAEKKETDIKKLLNLCEKENHLEWANWVITKLMKRKQRIRYAVYAAQQVLHIFEEKYPEDTRPRLAIEAAIKCIDKNTKKNRDAARAAAWAVARAAARAVARDAAGAARDAAWDAAGAAAWDAAGDAARAARAAAWAAAGAKMMLKILNYGVKLLEEQ